MKKLFKCNNGGTHSLDCSYNEETQTTTFYSQETIRDHFDCDYKVCKLILDT